MSKSDFSISGLDEFIEELDSLSETVEANAIAFKGQLSIETELILNELDTFNDSFGSNFSKESTDNEYLDFFGNLYQEILSEGIFEKNYNPKKIFNARYKPYAKVE